MTTPIFVVLAKLPSLPLPTPHQGSRGGAPPALHAKWLEVGCASEGMFLLASLAGLSRLSSNIKHTQRSRLFFARRLTSRKVAWLGHGLLPPPALFLLDPCSCPPQGVRGAGSRSSKTAGSPPSWSELLAALFSCLRSTPIAADTTYTRAPSPPFYPLHKLSSPPPLELWCVLSNGTHWLAPASHGAPLPPYVMILFLECPRRGGRWDRRAVEPLARVCEGRSVCTRGMMRIRSPPTSNGICLVAWARQRQQQQRQHQAGGFQSSQARRFLASSSSSNNTNSSKGRSYLERWAGIRGGAGASGSRASFEGWVGCVCFVGGSHGTNKRL